MINISSPAITILDPSGWGFSIVRSLSHTIIAPRRQVRKGPPRLPVLLRAPSRRLAELTVEAFARRATGPSLHSNPRPLGEGMGEGLFLITPTTQSEKLALLAFTRSCTLYT